MSLAIDHRPRTFDEVIGNQGTIKGIKSLFDNRADKFPHAILLTGPTGCGKTTVGRIISNVLGAKEADFREIDTADFRGIDTIREIRKQVRLKPQDPKSSCRVWLLDECHSISKDGQNALLKALEDAPGHVYFILCTTDPQKLLPTIQGRCTHFVMSPLNEGEMSVLLRKVCRAEKITLPNEARELIYEQSFGHPRNALKLLERVAGLNPEEMAEVIFEEAAKQNAAIDLARALIQKSPWKKISSILSGLINEDEEKLRRMILSYCNTILLKKEDFQAFIVMDEFSEPFYNTGKPGLTLACFKAAHAQE